MNYMDKEKAKRHAKQQAEQMYDQNYGNRDIGGGGGGNWGNIGNQYGMGGGGYGMQQGKNISQRLLPRKSACHARQ